MEDQESKDVARSKTIEIAKEATRDVSTAAVGALIGAVVGGVPGALIGAATSPVLGAAVKIGAGYVQRRSERAERILRAAMESRALSEGQLVAALEIDSAKADDFLSLLSDALQSDPQTDLAFAAVLGEMVASQQATERERIAIVADSLKGLRSVHMRLLRVLHEAGGSATAAALSDAVGIPEVELRSVVRELELRGMIKDIGKRPVEWKLRELGAAIARYEQPRRAEKPN